MEDTQKAKIRKNNIKLYPIYQMISFDLMFYFAVSILFYMHIKHLTTSEIVLLDSFYAFFTIIGFIIASMIVTKIGKKNTMVLGNIANIIGISIIMFGNIYIHFVIANFIAAFGFALKGVSESAFLNSTVPEGKEKTDICTRILEKGYSKFSYFSAITMFAAGFLYDINPYIPISCCLVCLVLSAILASNFIEVDDINENSGSELENGKKTSKDMMEVFKELKSGFKFVLRSKRLRSLIIMVNILWGIFCLMITYRPVLLEDINCSVGFIGIVAAIVQLAKGYYARRANKFHKKFTNKSLTIIGLGVAGSIILAGLITIVPVFYDLQVFTVVLCFSIIYALKGIEQVIFKRYYSNFTTPDILPKIYAIDGIVSGIGRMTIAFIGAVILDVANIKYAMIIIGVISLMLVLLASKYMKTRTGLKPEEYDEKDIMYQ